MTIINKIIAYLTKKTETVEAPEAYCPNCWGRQEYNGRFMEAMKNEKIDLNNIDQKKGWINAYFTRHFEGIKLRKTDAQPELVCAACNVSYRPE